MNHLHRRKFIQQLTWGAGGALLWSAGRSAGEDVRSAVRSNSSSLSPSLSPSSGHLSELSAAHLTAANPLSASLATTTTVQPNLCLVHCSGGWDPTMVFDNKIGISTIHQQAGLTNATAQVGNVSLKYVHHASRPSVKSFFDLYADRSVILNGLFIDGTTSKEQETNLLSCTDISYPSQRIDWLSFYAAQIIPTSFPHILIDMPYYSSRYSPVATQFSTAEIRDLALASTTESLSTAQKNAVADFILTRYNRNLDSTERSSPDYFKKEALRAQLMRQFVLPATVKANAAVLTTESDDFVHSGKFAVNLFKNKLSRCVSIRCGNDMAWDSHKNHIATQSNAFEHLFAGLLQIFAYAQAQGVLDTTTFVIVSEKGRSPYLNSSNGSDHWAYSSMLLVGPGLSGGKVIGETDSALRGQKIDPIFGGVSETGLLLTPEIVYTTLFFKYGIPYSLIMPVDAALLSPILAKS